MPKIPTSQLTKALLVSHMHISASTENKYFDNPKDTNLTEDIWFYQDDNRYFIYNNNKPDITQDEFLESIKDLPKDLQDLLFLMFENKLLYIIINDVDILSQDDILDIEELIINEPWLPIYHDDDCIYTPAVSQTPDITDLVDKNGNPVKVGNYLHMNNDTCVIIEQKENCISYRNILNSDTTAGCPISELKPENIEIVSSTGDPVEHVMEVNYQDEKHIVKIITPSCVTNEDISNTMDKIYVKLFSSNRNRQHRKDYPFHLFMYDVCTPNHWEWQIPVEFSWSD